MNETRSYTRHTVHHPDRAVRAEHIEPILFLADRMATRDPVRPAPARPMVERLAGMAGAGNFRIHDTFQRLNDAAACERLGTRHARLGALVVLSLVMKTDTGEGEAARAYFSGIRERLGLDAIAVPASVEDHIGLALEYLRD